jgi:hypothetical protein
LYSNSIFNIKFAWEKFMSLAPVRNTISFLKTVLPITVVSALGLAGCGGNGGGTIVPAVAIAFAAAPPSSVLTMATAQIAATVSNDRTAAGVNWTIKCGSSQCGSLSASHTASGAQTVYTAPAAVPTPAEVTITATAAADTTQQVSGTVTIDAAPPTAAALADGTYVYHFSGQDSDGADFVAGAFSVQNGAIVAGEQDFTDANSTATDVLNPSTSSISRQGGNIQIVLDTQDPDVGVDGVVTLRGAIVSATRVLISEFDASASGSGALDLQTRTAAPTGSYAFYVSGWGSAGTGMAIGGVLDIASGAINTANSIFDINSGLTFIRQAQSFASGTVSAPDSFGRVTLTLTPSLASGVTAFVLTGYVNGNQIQLVESQGDALNAYTGGVALSQGTYAGTFTTTSPSVAGVSYAFGASGFDANGTTMLAGGIALNANGTVSGAMARNDLVNSFGFSISGGTYTVDPTGRVTVSNVTSSSYTGALSFQLYLDGNGNALELGVDSTQVTGAQAYAQTAASAAYSGAFAVAAQGFWTASSTIYPSWSGAGVATITAGALSGFSDYTLQNPNGSFSPTADVSLSGTEDTTRGVFALNGLNASGFQGQSAYGYYPIDASRVIAVQVDGLQTGQQGVLMLEAVQSN